MMDAQQGAHGDAAAYTLGALDEAARARFEAHAAVCPECLREAAAFREVADRLALAVPQVAPPRYLAERLLARARDLVPGLVGAAAPSVRESIPLLAAAPGAPLLAAPPAARQARRRWAWSLRAERASFALAGVSLAVSLLIALAGTSYAFASQQQLQQTAQSAAQLAETLQLMYQPGTITKLLNGTELSPQAKGRLWMVPDAPQAVIMTYDLPPLAAGESYQCWLTDDDKRANGGVFRVDGRGRGYLMVKAPDAMYRYRWVGVTKEPARGSPHPTGPRLLRGEL